MYRPIALSLSPNTKKEDVFLALTLLFSPWRYKRGSSVKLVEQWFRQYFNFSYAVSFASGRASLIAILKALEIKKGDEVILQAFTCVAVPNAVRSVEGIPVFTDITDALTMDPQSLQKKITKKTKAIIVQHTFGIPADMDAILTIAKKNNIPVIEDVAHSIGGTYHKKKLGTFGAASIFSFGRDKAFSSVFGGIAMTNNEDLGKKIRAYHNSLNDAGSVWIIQQLLHPTLFSLILPVYDFFAIGKILLVLFQKIHMLTFPVTAKEKTGVTDPQFVKKFPNALATLAHLQLKRVHAYNERRTVIVTRYLDELRRKDIVIPGQEAMPLVRFPLLIENPSSLIRYLRKYNIYIGSWYASVVDPKNTNYKNISYKVGMCPNAERIAARIVNLPTYSTMRDRDVDKVIALVNSYAYI